MRPPPTSSTEAIISGATMGLYATNAVLGLPIAFVLAVFTPFWYISIMFVVAAIIGVAGWKRDFDLKWHPYTTSETPPNETM